ncbi:MAG: hypothetical protein ACXACU_04910, partial [Candidatus Hodarchaeales archaeon]
KDFVAPIVDTPIYYSALGDNGTFKVNVSDPWGEIDTVIVNITLASGVSQENFWSVMVNTSSGYMTDALLINKGIFHYIIIANDTERNLGISNEIISSIPNHFPEITEVRLSSDQNRLKIPIYSNNTLYLQYSFYDRDGDSEGDSEIRWYKNRVLQSSHNDSRQIPASYLTKNDRWFVTVKPKDEQDFGIKQTSVNITILNVPPRVYNYSYIFNSKRSQIIPDIRSTMLGQVFFVEDETISISYEFEDSDQPIDYDQSKIQWFCKLETDDWEEVFANQNKTFILPSDTSPGECWKCMVTPYDGTDFGKSVNLSMISIESRPCITFHNVSSIIVDDKGVYQNEGKYKFQVGTSNLKPITSVEFSINDSSEVIYFAQRSTQNNSIWILDYNIPPNEFYNYFQKKVLKTQVRVCSFVDSQDQECIIYANYTFLFVVEDRNPPRVVGNPRVEFNNDLNPTYITFYSNIIDYGSEIEEVSLYYYFREITDNNTNLAGIGAELQQDDIPKWYVAEMSLLSVNLTNAIHSYSVAVPFDHNNTSRAIIYYIKTTDSSGNSGIPYNILTDPDRIREFHFEKDLFQIDPIIIIIIIFITICSTLTGSIIYLKMFRKPDVIGFDKELVLNKISEVNESETRELLDIHTLGVVTAFFDQRRGPTPIIVTPEILKDNLPKLIELSDRSFGGLGFNDNFEGEITSNFDFLLSQNSLIKSLSFGFTLQRPKARGGKENLTLNVLIYQDVFPIIFQFLDEVRERVQIVHKLMNNQSSEKELILTKIIEIRKYISSIILAYEKIYDTTDLIKH